MDDLTGFKGLIEKQADEIVYDRSDLVAGEEPWVTICHIAYAIPFYEASFMLNYVWGPHALTSGVEREKKTGEVQFSLFLSSFLWHLLHAQG